MLDEGDRRILRILQQDGRITNQELAARCAMSPSACLERMRRLRERGYIRGYAALLDAEKLGQGFLVEVLAELPGVRETRTYTVMEEVKSSTALAI